MACTRNGNPKTSTLILVVILLPLLALPIMLAMQTIYHAGQNGAAVRRAPAAVADTRQGYAWLDRKSGVVRIPIERAMMLVVKEADGQGASE